MKHIMLDLETLGTGYNAAIVAIGACEFDLPGPGAHNDENPISHFYCKVDLPSSVAAGMEMDAPTVLWWMKQSEAARESTFEGLRTPLGDALMRFNSWVYNIAPVAGRTEPDRADVWVWGNGATFDNVVIRSAFKAVRLTPCWSFRNDKCYRTVRDLLPKNRQPEFVKYGTAHNALDDAIAQALHLQKVWKELGL